jgi:hypothetical protein
MILHTDIQANMELIRQRRLKAVIKNNKRENKQQIACSYQEGDYVLIISGQAPNEPKLKLDEGPYIVLIYNELNRILHIQRRNYVEPIHIRRDRPYFGAIQRGD